MLIAILVLVILIFLSIGALVAFFFWACAIDKSDKAAIISKMTAQELKNELSRRAKEVAYVEKAKEFEREE